MARQELGECIKRSKPVGLALALVVFLTLLIASLAGIVFDSMYNSRMAKLDRAAQPADGAHGVVVYLEEEDFYTDQYVPKDLRAGDVDEVAAVILCAEGSYMDGIYENGVRGFVRTRTLSWFDLATQQVLAQETFEGGPSPQSIDADVKKDQYGSEPQDSEMTAWIRQIAERCLP